MLVHRQGVTSLPLLERLKPHAKLVVEEVPPAPELGRLRAQPGERLVVVVVAAELARFRLVQRDDGLAYVVSALEECEEIQLEEEAHAAIIDLHTLLRGEAHPAERRQILDRFAR